MYVTIETGRVIFASNYLTQRYHGIFSPQAGTNPAAANAHGSTPLSFAAFNGRPRALTLLLSAGASANSAGRDGFTPLMSAARGGHGDAVTVLVAAKADVNAATVSGLTVLMAACQADTTDSYVYPREQ